MVISKEGKIGKGEIIMYEDQEYYLQLIRSYRKKRKYNQQYLADLLKVPRTTYQAIESGRNRLKLEDFTRIVNILQIPLSELEEEDHYLVDLTKEDILQWSQVFTKFQTAIEIVENEKEVKINFKTKQKI